jgi:hypothetical protein
MAVTHAYTFGLDSTYIAARVAEGAWGTNYRVEAVKMFDMEIDLETGELAGDDVILDQHSKIQAINGGVTFGFKDPQVLAALTNITLEEYSNYEMITFGRNNMGYFGITGRAYNTSGGGDKQLFIPKAKITENFKLGFEKGQYVIPNVRFRGVWENDTYGAGKVVANETAQAVTVPPTMAS